MSGTAGWFARLPLTTRLVARFGSAVSLTTLAAAAVCVAYYWLRSGALSDEVQLFVVEPGVPQDFRPVSVATVILPPLIVTAAVCALAAAIAGFWFARRLSAPLLRLELEMEEVGRGNLSRVVRLRGGGEMQEVADHFSAMTHRLGEEVRTIREEALSLGQTVDALDRALGLSGAEDTSTGNLVRALRSLSTRLRDRLEQFSVRS